MLSQSRNALLHMLRLCLRTAAFCALILCLTAPALADIATEPVRGVLLVIDSKAGTEHFLVSTASPEPLRIITTNPSLKTDFFSKLKNGDLLIGRGAIQAAEKTVRIDAIESLGLRELLGSWRSEKWEVYEFRDFHRMNLYLPAKSKAKPVTRVPLAKAAEYSYVLAPEQGDRYSIFFSDNQSVTVGSIEVQEKQITLSVIDPETGAVSENISLSPLSL